MATVPGPGAKYDGEDLRAGEDGLPVREVGPWSRDKHHYLRRYIFAFTTAMKGKPSWRGLGYIDLFCGPGLCRLRDSDEEIDGSPLIALASPKPFDVFVFVDKSRDAIEALEKRFADRCASVVPYTRVGDCNEEIEDIVRELPADFLYLAFIDPTGLHIHFDTIRALVQQRRVDLIISWMDHLDLLRNVDEYYYHDPDSNLDYALGKDLDWRREYDALLNRDAAHKSRFFLDLYQRQLASLGYHFGVHHRISGVVPFYLLLFASRHDLGVKLWNQTSKKDRRGQKRLF